MKNTVAHYYKIQMIIALSVSTLFSLMALPLFLYAPSQTYNRPIGLFILLVLFLVLLSAYPIIQYVRYRHIKLTHIQTVLLDKVKAGFSRNLYFTVQMEIEGIKKEYDTKAIFFASMWYALAVENYSMKQALVGYDEKSGQAVVIKLIEV